MWNESPVHRNLQPKSASVKYKQIFQGNETHNQESVTTVDPTGLVLSGSTAVLTCSLDGNDNEKDMSANVVQVLFNPALKHKLETIKALNIAKGKIVLLMDAVRQKKL